MNRNEVIKYLSYIQFDHLPALGEKEHLFLTLKRDLPSITLNVTSKNRMLSTKAPNVDVLLNNTSVCSYRALLYEIVLFFFVVNH
jgi:hypothetical protein